VDGSLRSLRELNRRRVVEELLARGVASRAEIARRTGLSRSTVSSLVNDLLETGLVSERVDASLSGAPSQPGRPPVLIALDHSAGAAVGIDFGHSHLAVAVSDLAHSVLAEDWREMDVDHAAREGLDAAAGVRQPLVKFAAARPDLRVMEERFMAIEQAMCMPQGRAAGARYLRAFVEEMKSSGFVAAGLERSGQGDAMVAPPAPAA
jgi:predicted ArsR family transcriptional regulator